MKKYIYLLAVLAACSTQSEKKAIEPLSIQKAMGVYTGVTPCADCEGIYTRIEFIDSATFIKSSKYLGKSSRAFLDMGQWSIKNDSVLTTMAHGNQQQYLFEDNSLIILNQDGKRIKGALANYYRLNKGEPEAKKNWSNQIAEGLDFVARGNEPYWNLEIDFDKNVRFTTLESDSIVSATPTSTQEGNTTVLTINDNEQQLIIKLSPVGCINNMSGAYSDYAVEINYNNGAAQQGCGSFINPAYHLAGTWQLTNLNGEAALVKDYPNGIPAITFEVFNSSVSGNGGCNRLSGSYKADESGSLIFAPLALTRMFCQDKNKEATFMTMLKNTNRYTLEADKLLLLKGNEVLAEFSSQ